MSVPAPAAGVLPHAAADGIFVACPSRLDEPSILE